MAVVIRLESPDEYEEVEVPLHHSKLLTANRAGSLPNAAEPYLS
jgi:hypothetical protein